MPKKRKTKKSPRKTYRKESYTAGARKITRTPLTRKIYSFFFQFFKKSSLQTKLLLASGVFLILVPTFFYINEGIQLTFFTPRVIPVKKLFPPPTWISIPSVNIELPIQETAIHGNSWDVAENAISHLTISARPNEDGPIILYGHNTNNRFGPIRWLSVGKTITINSQGNKSYTYIITKIVEVDPQQVSILTLEKGQTLILYTCSGFADLKRFVVIAKLQ